MIRPVAADGRIETGGAFTPIHRPRVVERIQSAATQRIVLIIAPAGYGKSVALRQYLETVSEPCVQYDLRAENATLLGFVRGLTENLTDFCPDARKTISGAFDKTASSTTPGSDLAMWMHAHLKTFSGVIAVDDLHIAENEPEVSKFLVSLIERTKGRVRWVIASRSTLDLPVGSWLAYGEMDLNIDEQDLRFSLDEARTTAKSARVGVRDEELNEILNMTEGWPTALSFAVRSSTRSVDLRNIAASTREMVYRYLAEQVYESLNEDERELLHFVGFLPEIDLEILRRAGYGNAKALVERLRDRVAFIYPHRPSVYRCHDLFREFLQHQLELSGDSAVSAMRSRVAEALEQGGELASALEAYTATRSEPDILRLLNAHGFVLMEQAHADAVSAALESLSDEARAVNPIVLALRGLREVDAGRIDRGESLLRRALQRTEDDVVAADIANRLALILFNHGRDLIPLLEPFLKATLPDTIYATAVSLLAPAYANAGRAEDAYRLLKIAEECAANLEADQVRARLLHRMAAASMALGLPSDRVMRLYSEANTIANQVGLYLTSAAALGGMAVVASLYEDDTAKTIWYSQQAVTAASKAGDRASMQRALVTLINGESKRGNLERITLLEQQFAAVSGADSSFAMYAVPSRAMVSAWKGNFDEAFRLMCTIEEKPFYNFDRVLNGALQAVYAFGAGLRERALGRCERVVKAIDEESFEYLYGRHQAEFARLLCAAVQALCGRGSAATRLMQKRPIIDDAHVQAMRDVVLVIQRIARGTSMPEEMEEPLAMLDALGYGGIRRVLQIAISRTDMRRETDVGGLTPAEKGVLEALGNGLSPKDIADETGRSVYTIQAHIQNAIRKLGCSGRNEAMTIARKRGLIG